MKSSARRLGIWLTIALFCLVSIGISWSLLYRSQSATRTYDRLFDQEVRNQTSLRFLQVGFKKQVQEWKDILLRGRDPKDFTDYSAGFRRQDQDVRQAALALRSVDDPAIQALLDQFIVAHEKLDADYAAALKRFVADGMVPYEADRMVRGEDRPPTDLIDKIANLMSEHTGNQVKAQNLAQTRALMVFLAGIGVLLVVAVQRAIGSNLALQRSEEHYRTLVETSPDAIVAADRRQKITMCNQRAVALFGCAGRAEIVGKYVGDLVGSVDNGSSGDPGQNWSGAFMLQRQDGSSFPGELITAQLSDSQHKQVGYMVIIRDMTERRQAEEARVKLEEQLAQASKMESVGRLAGGVAHDFNNLLTVINGFSDLVLKRLAADDSNRERVQQIRNAGGQAAELTRQLLAFSRKQPIQPRVISLNTMVRAMEDMVRGLLPETIETIIRLEPSLGHVMADPGQMHQVLVNLVINARDAMPSGGKLIMETSNVELDGRYAAAHPEVTPGPCVLLEVSDTGVGMDESVRARIFEPFFTTKGTGKGTGLGLATVYGIVRQSEGWIWVYSEPGKGTSFRIYIPRVNAGISPSDFTSPVQDVPQGTETVLLVEDREDVRKMTREVLESCGYKVLAAENGDVALRLAECHAGPIELLLTDVVMPGMNGQELAGRLKEFRPATKTLFMSGYSENVIVHQGLLSPGIAYIAKPMSPDALAVKIRETLETTRRANA